jgi:hypothetical protein
MDFQEPKNPLQDTDPPQMNAKLKAKLRKMAGSLPTADYQLHYRLREILSAHGPCRFATLRTEHGVSPIDVERQVQTYPEIFYVVINQARGQRTIALHSGELPSRENVHRKKQLIALVRKAAPTGIYLST